MWVVFRKSDNVVVGTSAHSKGEIKKSIAIRQVVKGLVKGGKIADFNAIQVTDEEEALALLGFGDPGPGGPPEIVLEEDVGGSLKPVAKAPEIYSLTLETDVAERHPADGIPLIPADGESVATITVQKLDREGKAVTRAADRDELWLRTDHGTLLNAQGDAIRNLSLTKGAESFQLRSGTAFRVATVEVMSADPKIQDAAIRIEFI